MLELRSIAKRLGAFAIRQLSLEVPAGEYFILLGPSGAGKSVLMEIIAGLVAPDEGHVLWRSEYITCAAPEARRFALVYQDYALFPHQSVRGNIAYGLRARRVKPSEAHRRIAETADLLHIGDLLDRRINNLSGGEKQRVALARALVTQPQVLMLDEPLAALDRSLRLEMRRELKRLQERMRTTFIHVTHDVEEAMTLADRIGVMFDGRLRQVGSAEALFRRPSDREVASFLGLMNVLPARWLGDGRALAGGVEIHAADVDGDVSHIWIKPEEIVLSREPFVSSARNQFRCRVTDVQPRDMLMLIGLRAGDLDLYALVTHASFTELKVESGAELLATFKSSAVHGF